MAMTSGSKRRPFSTREVNGRAVATSGPAPLGWDRTDEQLAALAVTTAKRGVAMLEDLGIDPDPDLLARAAGDPDRVAAFVARHAISQAHSDVA